MAAPIRDTLTATLTALELKAIHAALDSSNAVDIDRFTSLLGFKNANTASVTWHLLKKKLDNLADIISIGEAQESEQLTFLHDKVLDNSLVAGRDEALAEQLEQIVTDEEEAKQRRVAGEGEEIGHEQHGGEGIVDDVHNGGQGQAGDVHNGGQGQAGVDGQPQRRWIFVRGKLVVWPPYEAAE
ncbi:unnamed protein product [Zymoseptoria tritici ST99CH_1E4]|uniref:Uncharacterized protein n=1 Tax=Zymoseptoria tritici ST99CH_1E4 TaxID=1276532 RepID=A0A2H1GNG7_ZYMTR|nr:unnamed protein product [Zymoseptoria tritici ST99CH_1E4]